MCKSCSCVVEMYPDKVNMNPYLIVIMVCVVCFVALFLHYNHFLERYVNVQLNASTALNKTFGEQPCSVLQTDKMSGNALLMANSYIDANRLKVWSPNDATRKHGDLEYCYINNDDVNNNQDYLMMNKSCSKSTDIFKNASFVKDAFNDKMGDKSHMYPIQKCVIAIDKTKVDVDTLTDFWNQVGTTECIQVNEPLRQDNIKLHSELDDFSSMNANLTNEVESQKFRIDDLNIANDVCSNLSTTQATKLAIDALEIKDLTVRHLDCTSNLAINSSRLHVCTSNLDVSGATLTGRTFLQYSNALMQLSNGHSLLLSEYADLGLRYNDTYTANKGYISSNTALNADYAACAKVRSMCLSNEHRLQGLYDTSSQNLFTCVNSLSNLNYRYNNLESDYSKTGDALNKYTNLYNKLNSENAAMSSQITQLNAHAVELASQLQQSRQDVYNIGSVTAINDYNQRMIDALGADVSRYKKAHIDSISQNASNLSSTYNDLCKNNGSEASANLLLVSSNLSTLVNIMATPKPEAPPPPPPPSKHAWFVTTGDYTANDIRSFAGGDVHECKRECVKDPKCTQFNFDNKCYLKYGSPPGFSGQGSYYYLIRNHDLVEDVAPTSYVNVD